MNDYIIGKLTADRTEALRAQATRERRANEVKDRRAEQRTAKQSRRGSHVLRIAH